MAGKFVVVVVVVVVVVFAFLFIPPYISFFANITRFWCGTTAILFAAGTKHIYLLFSLSFRSNCQGFEQYIFTLYRTLIQTYFSLSLLVIGCLFKLIMLIKVTLLNWFGFLTIPSDTWHSWQLNICDWCIMTDLWKIVLSLYLCLSVCFLNFFLGQSVRQSVFLYLYQSKSLYVSLFPSLSPSPPCWLSFQVYFRC